MEQLLAGPLTRPRFGAVLLAVLASMTVLLAVIGAYGTLAIARISLDRHHRARTLVSGAVLMDDGEHGAADRIAQRRAVCGPRVSLRRVRLHAHPSRIERCAQRGELRGVAQQEHPHVGPG